MTINNKILIISPHCDDESYGMGGTILKKIDLKFEVFILVICAGNINFEHSGPIDRSVRINEFNCVLKLYNCLGRVANFYQESQLDRVPLVNIINEIEHTQDLFKADTWYVPGLSFHQDHRIVYEAYAAAARPTRKNVPKEIYSYEHPLYSWNPPVWRFIPHVYENIEKYLDQKIEICELYKSQLRNNVLGIKHIREYSVACGTEAGFGSAERFSVERIIKV